MKKQRKHVYGDKRDYRKIDIYLRMAPGWAYGCSTTWARTCKEAKQRFLDANPKWAQIPDKVKASFAK